MFCLKLVVTVAFANRRRGGKKKAYAPLLLHYADIFQVPSFLLLLTNSVKQEHAIGPYVFCYYHIPSYSLGSFLSIYGCVPV